MGEATAAASRWTLAFSDHALEGEYRRHRSAAVYRQYRVVAPFGALLWAASCFLEISAGGPDRNLTLALRFLIGMPPALLACALIWAPPAWFDRLWQAGLAAVIGGIGLSILAMCAMQVEITRANPNTGWVLLIVAGHTLAPQRFVRASLVTGLLIAADAIVIAWIAPVSLLTASANLYYLASAQLMGMLASYQLEGYQRRDFLQTRAIRAESLRSEGLLLNVLPGSIAERLKLAPSRIADHFEEVTVLFGDLVGFTTLAQRLSAAELVAMLDEVFTRFDACAERHGLEKIKTIGDSYMVVGGLPEARADHAQAAALMALEMIDVVATYGAEKGLPLGIRVGINSGPVVAGVIGKKKFIYDLWGDTVNTASRMESHGLEGQVQVGEATWQRLREQFLFEARGLVNIKGKGPLETWLLKGRRAQAAVTGPPGR